MTFLEICKAVRRECGISGTGPAAVTGQTGEMLRIVNWVIDSHKEICRLHDNWLFLRSSFTVDTVSGTASYLPSTCTDSRLSAAITAVKFNLWLTDTFRIYKSSDGVATQQLFTFEDFEFFRDYYLLGTVANARPAVFTIRPDDDAILPGPTPDAVYVITGDYQRFPADLAADGDVPAFPAKYHDAVTWLAARKYALYEEAAGLYRGANREYARILSDLELKFLPPIRVGGPLA